MWIIGFAVFALGMIFVIVVPINKKRNVRCSEETQGILLKETEKDGGYVYVYSYYVDGFEYTINSTIHSNQAKSIGDTCTIWYNPEMPMEAQPFRYGSAKVYNIILAFGIVMIPLGIILTLAGAAMQSI